MGKKIRFCVIILFIALGLLNCAGIQGLQDIPSVTIVNNTGTSIYYIFMNETASSLKGKDRLDSDQVIRNGQSVTLNLMYPLERVSTYNFRLIDSEGNSYIKTDVQVSTDSRIVFTASDLSQGSSITIENNTGFTIWYIRISETISNSWGWDWLEDEVLYNGNSVTFKLPDNINKVNSYDIMLVAQNENKYVKMNVPVSGNDTITFTQSDRQY